MNGDRSNFKDDILKAAGDEPIEAIVISDPGAWDDSEEFGTGSYRDFDGWPLRPDHAGRVMSWTEAAPLLDVEYDTGYGGQDCPSIRAWTPTRVLFVGTYDGSTWIASVPRNPVEGRARSIGGG